jgi:hypothetical protein
MRKSLKIQAERQPISGSIALYMFQQDGEQVSIVENMQMRAINPVEFAEPSARISTADAQALADSLWDAGIRPAQSKMSAGAFDAQGAHLADMRAIAFGKLSIEAPK